MPSLPEPLTLLQAADVADWYEHLAPRLPGWLVNTYPGCAPDVDDIIGDIFVEVIRRVAHLSTLEPLHRQNYLFRIAKSVMAQRYRDTVAIYPEKGTVRPYPAAHAVAFSTFADVSTLDAEPVTASHDWTANATQMEQTTAARLSLKAVWERVPVEQRELLLMVAYGYSNGEMMTHLRVNKGQLATRIWRLRLMLRDVKEQVA